MEWLANNWISILLVLGVFFLMRRGGMGCGLGHRHHREHAEGQGAAPGAGEATEKPRQHGGHGCC